MCPGVSWGNKTDPVKHTKIWGENIKLPNLRSEAPLFTRYKKLYFDRCDILSLSNCVLKLIGGIVSPVSQIEGGFLINEWKNVMDPHRSRLSGDGSFEHPSSSSSSSSSSCIVHGLL